jgi:CRP-like cAMP-binding protein
MTNVLENPPFSPGPIAPGTAGLLSELSRTDVDRLRLHARLEVLAAGAPLWEQGRPATACAVVASGTAEVHRGGRRVGRIEPGALVGVAAILARHPHRTTAIAATPMTVWWLDGDTLDRLVLEAPTFAHALVRRLARATVAANF